MNKEEYAIEEKIYKSQDGLEIKIIHSNLERRYKKIGTQLYLMPDKESAKLEDSLTTMVRLKKENDEIDRKKEIEKIRELPFSFILFIGKVYMTFTIHE